MSKAKTLDQVSGISFFLGLVSSKIQYLPLPVLTPFANFFTLGFYLLGYSVWFMASHFYPNHKQHSDQWYGFAKFKEQNIYAATIGLSAAILSAVAIAAPILLLPAAWLFFASNALWTIGEYHKYKNPPHHDKDYSESHQRTYFKYAITLTVMSLLTALSATLVFVFPPIAIPALIITVGMTIGLGILAAEQWFSCMFGDHKKTPLNAKNSYNGMQEKLGNSKDFKEAIEHEPYHANSPISSARKPVEIELIETPPCFSYPTCSAPQ